MEPVVRLFGMPRHPLVNAQLNLLEEIAWLEMRLIELRHNDDSACARRLAISYDTLLKARRAELTTHHHPL
jgi:hypothetical protein